jgi:mannose-6-phosphate isomerase-like protein (cupin superfamily)
MSEFLKLADGIDTKPILTELFLHDELWNQNAERKDAQDSPHAQMSDIWIRYNSLDNIGPHFNDEHRAVFYPAWHVLPSIHLLIFGLMAHCKAVELCGILITKIPPGCGIEAHEDHTWHSHWTNLKAYTVLQGNDQCWYRCRDEYVFMKTGEVWTFNNNREHEVKNFGNQDRITLISCMRCP